MTTIHTLSKGSLWRRWDPHIHAPGTVLNNQFGGEKAWDEYIEALETSNPQIQAIGVTDYYLLDSYERIVEVKRAKRLGSVGFIFPNLELRLATGTDRSRAVNFHLLINPEDEDHVAQTKRFLSRLTFRYRGEKYGCTEEDLRILGRAHDPDCTSDAQALRAGVNQFKVEFDQFVEEWEASDWIRKNALIAVATNRADGTSGLQTDASLEALRRKIEQAAHIMFSGSPSDRDYWLGKSRHASADEITKAYGSLKPCLHGSDAHQVDRVGKPDKDRYSWIKGDLNFESLRQICMEPESRVVIGSTPPTGPIAANVIESVGVNNASWFIAGRVPLNPGLVGIIGPRGSGKTALADMIAAGAHSLSAHVNERSFVQRAQEYIYDEEAQLEWADGGKTGNELKHVDLEGMLDDARVQYLSQQFVERLCSAAGATDELISEIKRVIYSAHPAETRQGATSFDELLDIRAALGRQTRQSYERSIAATVEEIAAERDKIDALQKWRALADGHDKTIKSDESAKRSLITKENAATAKAFEDVTKALESKRQAIGKLDRQKSALHLLQADVREHRDTTAPAYVRRLTRERADAGLEQDEWKLFLTDFAGDVDALLKARLATVEAEIKRLSGAAPVQAVDESGEVAPSDISLLPADTALNDVSLRVLEAEARRLEALIGVDRQRRKQLASLTEKIAKTNTELDKLKVKIADAETAQARIDALSEKRGKDYAGVFNGILAEESALRTLYAPLEVQLKAAEGAVARLSVSIRRHVDIEAWAKAGEDLLDLRRGDGFRGRGALLAAAQTHLEAAWGAGDGETVALAMAAFRSAHDQELIKSSPYDRKTQLAEYRQWARQISAWIYGTEHVSVSYSLTYDSVEIERLSPGTRGIVLLLLYLAIDRDDDRPLIIDQPEENLDPKSIFEELVERFRSAKHRRQIIIVTHNANLIVNADADQVIVAHCGPHNPGGLPDLSYECGGLEDSHIRAQVCDILEGGERAFRERARRLRVTLTNG
ncbi:TrlF family AAA-like ATPase [Henriciella mobilis]|uniref:ATP-binding protein n=1 Tax=Henriciella mobilis TaxID=2305467 RepID=A0A399RQY3_9PROT|nr:ATP-binding protein [Henriciella mobilis]